MVRPPPTSGRGGAGLQTAESNGCTVKKWDRDGKSEPTRCGPVKRKEPSELKRRGGQKETEQDRGDPQRRNRSSVKRLKEGGRCRENASGLHGASAEAAWCLKVAMGRGTMVLHGPRL